MSALDTPVDNFAEWVGRRNREAERAGGSMGPTTLLGTISSPVVAGKPFVVLPDRPDLLKIVAYPRGYTAVAGDLVAVTRSPVGYVIVNVMTRSTA